MVGHALQTPALYLALAGAVSAWYMYLVNPAVPAAIGRALRPLVVILENKYYLDWFNENVLARGARAIGTAFWQGGDRGVIETGVVNASWKLVGAVSAVVRHLQSGYLYHYALVMIVGVLAFMTYFVWLAK
jgi:NADH-quinone oxidoreductase subunit L